MSGSSDFTHGGSFTPKGHAKTNFKHKHVGINNNVAFAVSKYRCSIDVSNIKLSLL